MNKYGLALRERVGLLIKTNSAFALTCVVNFWILQITIIFEKIMGDSKITKFENKFISTPIPIALTRPMYFQLVFLFFVRPKVRNQKQKPTVSNEMVAV